MSKFLLETLIISSVICSLIVITSTNPVIAIIYLIGVFISAALYLILTGLGFIGLSYIIVYIGAITVLFLFVIMMINTDILDIIEIGPEYGKNIPLAYTISILFIVYFIALIPVFLDNVYDNREIFYFLNNIIFQLKKESFSTILTLDSSSNILDFKFDPIGIEIENINTTIAEIQNLKSTDLLLTNYNLFNPEISFSNVLQIEILGELLYSYLGIILILSSMVLLLALVAPIILSK